MNRSLKNVFSINVCDNLPVFPLNMRHDIRTLGTSLSPVKQFISSSFTLSDHTSAYNRARLATLVHLSLRLSLLS